MVLPPSQANNQNLARQQTVVFQVPQLPARETVGPGDSVLISLFSLKLIFPRFKKGQNLTLSLTAEIV